VERDLELMCSEVTHVGKPLPVAFASFERGILHLDKVSPFGQKIGDGTLLACYYFLSSFLISAHLCFMQGVPQRGMDALVSQEGSSQVQEKMSLFWHLSEGMPGTSSTRRPCLKANVWRLGRSGRWLRRDFTT
jgi:hypothetical protein